VFLAAADAEQVERQGEGAVKVVGAAEQESGAPQWEGHGRSAQERKREGKDQC